MLKGAAFRRGTHFEEISHGTGSYMVIVNSGWRGSLSVGSGANS